MKFKPSLNKSLQVKHGFFMSPPSKVRWWFYFLYHLLLLISPGRELPIGSASKTWLCTLSCQFINDKCTFTVEIKTDLHTIFKIKTEWIFRTCFFQKWLFIRRGLRPIQLHFGGFKIKYYPLYKQWYCSQIKLDRNKTFRTSLCGYPMVIRTKTDWQTNRQTNNET